MAPNVGYVIAAYVITALALGGYTLWLLSRAKIARRRAEAIRRRREA
jgi:heme export protein D (CcmD)